MFVTKLNLDEAPKLAARFGMTAIPLSIGFKNRPTGDDFRRRAIEVRDFEIAGVGAGKYWSANQCSALRTKELLWPKDFLD